MKTEFMRELRDYLGGSSNSDKLFWSEFESLLDGKEQHYIKINVVDTSKAGNEYNDDVAEVSNVLAYSDNVHPNLAGATPGKSQMNNSGSDKRELFTLKQIMLSPFREVIAKPYHVVLHYNGWSDKFTVKVPIMQLTTLDKNKDAEVVEPSKQ